jgi:tetratricopeptide (TPR) repeat protein
VKRALAACLAVSLLAALSEAQTSKLEQAVARSEQQLAAGKPADAARTLAKAAEAAGAPGQIALGRLQERIGETDAAAAAYERARTLAEGQERVDALAASVHFLLRRGHTKEALALAEQAVALARSSPALAALARAQVLALDDSVVPLATAEQAVAAGGANGWAELARGEALLAADRLATAEAPLRRANELMPRSGLAESRLALLLIALGKPAEALAAARRASELDGHHGEIAATLALALIAVDPQKNWSEAISHAQTAPPRSTRRTRSPTLRLAASSRRAAGSTTRSPPIAGRCNCSSRRGRVSS